MIKLVLNDFRYHFKPGLKKCGNYIEEWYVYIHMLVLVPFLMKGKMGNIVYYGVLIPMILAILASRIYGRRLEKVLFLSPMGEKERKNFYLISYRIRTLGAAFLLLMNCFFLCLFGKMTLFGAALSLMAGLPFIFAVNVYCRPGEETGVVRRKSDLPGGYGLLNAGMQITALIFVVEAAGCAEDRLNVLSTFDAVMLTITIVFHLFFSGGMLLKYFRLVMEHTISYEENS